jgi:hypothetical protein
MKNAFLSCAALWLALSFALSPVQAAVYDFSFYDISNPTLVYGGGTLTVSGEGSQFRVTAATGAIYDGYLAAGTTDFGITGLSGYAGADNILYFPAVLPTGGSNGPINGYVDFGGISFATTTSGQEFNLGGGGTEAGAPYYAVLNDSTLNPIGYGIGSSGQAQGSYDISLSVWDPPSAPGPTPGAGLLGLAFLVGAGVAARWRRLLTR